MTSDSRFSIDAHLAELQATLEREIPMCRQMGIHIVGCNESCLAVSLPLDPNRNHQQTAFAGSLNALCTITGWGTMFLLLRSLGVSGNIVIRRSSIKYHQPVVATEIVAHCKPVDPVHLSHFAEMYAEKGQAKLDLTVEIPGLDERTAVTFSGSYVVLHETSEAGGGI